MIKKSIDIFKISEINYCDRSGNLEVESAGVVKSTKFFPFYQNKFGKMKIFKPLSKTKPLTTPLFAYSETFCSYIINKYFDSSAPLYQLAICKGITEHEPKYYEKGTLVDSFLGPNQKFVSLLEFFNNNPDQNCDISKYVNCCPVIYDYQKIFNSDIFSKNYNYGEQLASKVLISILIRNENFHYENAGFIYEDEKIVSLAPSFDHEFCSMFLYADNKEKQKEEIFKFDYLLNVSNNSVLIRNISLIAERYPDICKKFVENIERCLLDLEQSTISIENDDFIGSFSSNDWLFGYTKFKEKDIEKANILESKIEKVSINTGKFFNNIIGEFIYNMETLRIVINQHLELKKQDSKEYKKKS